MGAAPLTPRANALVVVGEDGQEKVLYEPQPKQQEFHEATEPNVILEGSRGGGKSLCMRMDAHMRCLAMPGFKALILRRVMPELRRSHLVFIQAEADALGADYKRAEFTVYYPNGSILVFGHCEDDAAMERYLSSEFDAIYFDELVTFELRQFLLISACARSPKSSGRVAIVRGGTNPVGIGATWVKQVFLQKNPPREVMPDYIPADWRAIKVNLVDNAHIDQDDYMKRLRSLPSEALRRAYAYGEWVTEGQGFPEWREADPETGAAWHVIDDLPLYRGRPIIEAPWMHVTCSIDWGYALEGNPGVATWFANLLDGSAIAFDEYVFRETLPADAAKEIKRRSTQYAHVEYVGDPAMWEERSGESIQETFARNGVSMQEGDNKRAPGWMRVHAMLRTVVRTTATDARPQLQCWRPGVPNLIRTMPQMMVDPKNASDMVTVGVEDDSPDTLRYYAMNRPYASPTPEAAINPDVKEILDFIRRKQHAASRLGTEAVRAGSRR